MQASRRVVQALPRLAPGQQARNMSGHGTPEENTKWMKFWMYSTFVSVPLVAAFGYYTWYEPNQPVHPLDKPFHNFACFAIVSGFLRHAGPSRVSVDILSTCLCRMHGEHEHHHQPKYAYLKKRDKKFPWGSQCDLLDFSCGQEGH